MSARRTMMSDNDLVSDCELSELVSDRELESDTGLVSDNEETLEETCEGIVTSIKVSLNHNDPHFCV